MTAHSGVQVNLLDFIHEHRETLVLKPNDDSGDDATFVGASLDQAGWERAVRQAQRSPYVVQETVEAARFLFPMLNYGHLEFKEMQVDVHPQVFLGKVSGCSSWLSAANAQAFSTSGGLAPTFIIDSKER